MSTSLYDLYADGIRSPGILGEEWSDYCRKSAKSWSRVEGGFGLGMAVLSLVDALVMPHYPIWLFLIAVASPFVVSTWFLSNARKFRHLSEEE